MFDKIKFIFKQIDKRDLKLIILAIISCIILFFNTTSVFASSNLSWSDEKYSMSIQDLYNLMADCGYDVSGEDFSTYSYSKNTTIGANTTVSFSFGLLKAHLSNTNNTLLFSKINFSGDKFIIIVGDQSTPNFDCSSRDNLGCYYRISCQYIYSYIFDLENNKVTCGYNISSKSNIWQNLNLGTVSWFYNNVSNMELSYFSSFAYQQDLLFDSFYLVNGPIYSTNLTTNDKDVYSYGSILNKKISYKVTSSTYSGETYTGDISYSLDFEKWLTDGLSDTFLEGEYSYYLEQYMYSSDGFNRGVVSSTKICDVTFTGNSVFSPAIEEVEKVIRSYDYFDEYGYTIILCPSGDDSTFLLSTDLIILNANPIAMIPYFIFKYDYIYYPLSPISSDSGDSSGSGDTNSSGDTEIGVTTPSGDSTDVGGGISGIWQAIINLPKAILDGFIGLFVPSSEYFYNESEEEPRVLATF